jgi:hypothetical protein
MTRADHLDNRLLVRAVDSELSSFEASEVAAHVAECAFCRRAYEDLRILSKELESRVEAVPVASTPFERERLRTLLVERDPSTVLRPSPEKVLRRFGWGMAIAATLALGIMVAPKAVASPKPASSAFEVDGESFIPLPYSNPDLPVAASRIVEMQVPVASLADVGIALEPVSNEVSETDRSVLADVLVGTDGQPVGVHVLGLE